MWHRLDSTGIWLVCLESGDRVRESLESLCLHLGLEGAEVSGIGGLSDPELGYWRRGEYQRQILAGNWELLSLLGNISLYQGKPFAHLHVSLAGPDLMVRGGHFFEATVTATAEIFLRPCQPLPRAWDEQVGAGLWRPL